MSRSIWLGEYHKRRLIEARALLVSLIEPTLMTTSNTYTSATVQSNTQEERDIQKIIGDIERLLGY